MWIGKVAVGLATHEISPFCDFTQVTKMRFNETTNQSEENSADYGGEITEDEIEETEKMNYEGGQAFEPRSSERKLYRRTANNLLENSYYQEDQELKDAVVESFDEAADSNPDFVLRLAAYARQELGLRDISQLILALAVGDKRFNTYPPESGHQNDTRIRDYTPAIVRRMDEVPTVISVYFNVVGGDTLPEGLKRGLSDAINMMVDEYTLAKYSGNRNNVTLYDAFNLVHPEPENRVENWHNISPADREKLFKRFMNGELDDYDVEPVETPNTWEVVISKEGNNAEAWRSVVSDMGIMAKTRNIRNMLDSGLDGNEIFSEDDLERAEKSKMFPFRFYQAYLEYKRNLNIKDTDIENFLSEAIRRTAGNLPEEFEDALVVADTSGSMNSYISKGSSMRCSDIATFFAAVASDAGSDTGAFASQFQDVSFHNKTPALDRVDKINNLRVGGSTNGYEVFDTIREQEREYDRVVLLTDEQLWDSQYGRNRTLKEAFDEYRDTVSKDTHLYIINLQSYGDMSMPDGYENVYQISGWSENILKFVQYAENEQDILHEIADYQPHPIED